MTRWKDFTNNYFYKKYQMKIYSRINIYPEVQKGKKKMENTRHRKWKV